MKTALLIIDVQQALCTGDQAAFDIAAVVARINALSSRARSAGLPVVLIQHHEAVGPLQHGSAGWQLFDGLLTGPQDLRVDKTVCNSFEGTELQAQLQSHGVTRLIMCGLQSDHCVDGTVRGAIAHGYPVALATDAHSTVAQGGRSAAQITAHHNTALAAIALGSATVTPMLSAAALQSAWMA